MLGLYHVLVNGEKQYSIWGGELPIPSGWVETGRKGTREECLSWIAGELDRPVAAVAPGRERAGAMDVTPRETAHVAFRATTRGPRQVTWGQLGMWMMYQRLAPRHDVLNMRLKTPVPDEASDTDVIDAVVDLMRSHEALRTVFQVEGSGRPAAVVLPEGRLPVSWYGLTDPQYSSEAFVDEIIDAECGRPFDLARELPVRLAIIELPSAPLLAALSLAHTAVDGFSVNILREELHELMSRRKVTGHAAAPPRKAVPQPADVAAHECSEQGASNNRKSLEFWRSTLMKAPRSPFPWDHRPTASTAAVQVELRSRAVLLAVSELAARHSARMSNVMLAAVSAVLARTSGDPRAAFQVVCHNRFTAEIQSSVGCVAQGGLFFLDTGKPTFSGVIRAATRAAMGAYLSAGYDSLMRNAVALDVGAARGMHFDLHTIVSDEIFTDTTFTDSPVRHDPLVIEKALSETLVERVETRARPPERFFLHMTRLRDTARLLVKADARSFTDDQVADLLRAIEALLVRACATDASPAELVAGLLNDGFTRSPDWTHTHAGWVSLLAVERAVTKATGLQAKALAQASGDGIAVHLPPSARSIGHKALHSRVVRVLPEHPAAIAPTAYVF